MTNEKIDEAGRALVVQSHQREAMENQLTKASTALSDLDQLNNSNSDALDALLLQVENLCKQNGMDTSDVTQADTDIGNTLITLNEEETSKIELPYFEQLEKISASDNIYWNEYITNVSVYAEKNEINLSKDPFESLMTASEKAEIAKRIREDYTMQKAHCDKYDYSITAFCGVAAGLVDSFFVDMPNESKLGNWTDKQADNFVSKIAQGLWSGDNKKRQAVENSGLSKDKLKETMKKAGLSDSMPKEMPDTLQKCIQYLENKYTVNYDVAFADKLEVSDGVLKHMWTKNHHLKSLAHAPDLLGLVFSILDQFTGKASFVDNGKIIRVVPKQNKKGFELCGNNFFSKLFCGFCNWIGHLISDYVGSNTTRAIKEGEVSSSRGSGLAIPFYELLQFCNFGSFDVNGESITLAELSVKVFERGYDLRFAEAMAIPVLLNEIMIRLLWSLKSRFYHKKSWKDSMPFGAHPELRRMLLTGHGVLCIVDGADAAIRSNGQLLEFALHLNIVAWSRLAFSGLQEVRAIYKKNALDISEMDNDLGAEWNQLFEHSNANF